MKQVVYLFPQSVPIGVFDFCESLSSIVKLDSVIKYFLISLFSLLSLFINNYPLRCVVSEFVALFRPSTPLEICAIQRSVLEHFLVSINY